MISLALPLPALLMILVDILRSSLILPGLPLPALASCQALLLALWGATPTASPWKRLAGLVAGALYLEALIVPALRREFLGTSTITIAVTTATLFVVRTLGVRLARQADPVH